MSEDSYAFSTYSGLLTPEHYQRIGTAIWLFLWCISSTTREIEKDGVIWGIVKGNKPHKMSELAELFGVNEKTVRRWVDTLSEHDYVRITRAPYGLILTVKNSKKYKNRTDKNVQSDSEGERTDMSDQSANMSDLLDKNVRSNKDITGDITKDIINNATNAREGDSDGVPTTDSLRSDHQPISVDAEISQTPEPIKAFIDKFIELRAYGFDASPKDKTAAQEILDVVPLDKAIKLLEQRFESYKPKHPRQRINSLEYCAGYILDHYLGKAESKESKRANQRVAPIPKWMQDEPENDEKTSKDGEERAAFLKDYLNQIGGGSKE